MMKATLDTEKEGFLIFLWIAPLFSLLSIFFAALFYSRFFWQLPLITIIWFIVWRYIYQSIHTEVCFEGENVTLRRGIKVYHFTVTDVAYIVEKNYNGHPFYPRAYVIYLQSGTNLPFQSLLLRNKKIQNNINELFPNVPIKRSIVL